MALPIDALVRILVASLGHGDAITKLPEQIAPTLHFDGSAPDELVHVGRDGVHDIFIIDGSDQNPGTDVLMNWDVGEDLIVISTLSEPLRFLAAGDDTSVVIGLPGTEVDVVVEDRMVAEVRAMTLPFADDPFSSMLLGFQDDSFSLL